MNPHIEPYLDRLKAPTDAAVRELVDQTVGGMGEGDGGAEAAPGTAINPINFDDDRQLHSFEIDPAQVHSMLSSKAMSLALRLT